MSLLAQAARVIARHFDQDDTGRCICGVRVPGLIEEHQAAELYAADLLRTAPDPCPVRPVTVET